MERRTFFKIKLESFNLPGSVFSRLIIKELTFRGIFKWNLFFELAWKVGMVTAVVFLEGLTALS